MVKTWKMMLCLAVAAATCFVCGIVSVIRPRTTMAYDYIDVTGTDNIVSDFKMINGASVRFVAPAGIRFQSEMPITEYDKLKNEYKNVEIATLLIPTSVLGNKELTVDTENTLKISFTKKFVEDGKVVFKGVLTNIPAKAYTKELTAVSYVKAEKTDADTTTTYIQYASFNNGEKASVSRSIANVSEIALADDKFVKTKDMYLFLTEMAFSNATIAGNMSATADSTKTNVAVELKTSYTKGDAALGDNVISYVEYASSENGNIVTDADGKQYFYSASTGSYTVTSTAKIKQNGELNDIVAPQKTIGVSATAAQNALGNGDYIFSHNNYETDFFVKFLTNDNTATPYTLSYMHNGDTALDIMTINRDGKDYKYGTISLLHNDNMKNGGRYAEKGAKLDFSKGVYIKLIKYAKTNDQVVISLYTSQDGKTYTIYASAFYGGDDTFTGVSGMNATFNKIKLTASAPVFVSGFTATTDTSETKNTTLPEFDVLKVSLTASPDEIRVGKNSTLTPSVTYGGDKITEDYAIEYEITSDNEEYASIANGEFTSDVAGVYTVKISVTYAGKTETATATVTVRNNELSATLNFTDTVVETGKGTTADLSVEYNGEGVNTGYTVSYSVVSDNSANATVTNAGVFSATKNGVYTVRATVSYGGLVCYAEKNISVGNAVNVEIDLSGTTSVARTNVGVFLYENVSVNGVATDEYDVVFTADGGTVANYDGKYYFYATSADEYEITATVTIDNVAYEKTTTITVSGSTAYASIYSCDFNADYRASNGTIDSNVIIGKDGYYYGARNNAVDNALFFNGEYSVKDTYAIELYIKYIGTESDNMTSLFFSMYNSRNFIADCITLVRASGTTNASLTIAGAGQSGTKNFGDGAWLRIVRTTENGTCKFKVYVSEDKSTWTLWASANATGNYALNFKDFCLYSQTPVMVADFTVYEDASMIIDMTATAGSAYVDETVELASVVTFAGNELNGVNVVYSIVSGNGSIENGRLSANDTGDITVSATATYNGFTATTTKTITFNTVLTATFTASSNSVVIGGNVTLTLSSVNYHGNEITNGYTVEYVISPNAGASVSNGVFTATKEGTYTVTATITHTASGIELSKQVVIKAEPVITGSSGTLVSQTNINASGNFELQMYIEFMDPSSDNTLSFVRYQGDANNHAFMKINRNGNNGTIVIEQGNGGRTYYDAAGNGTASTTAAANMTEAGRSLNFANGVHIKLIRYLSGNVATLLIYVSEDGGLTYTPYAKSIYSAGWGWYDRTLRQMDITTTFNVRVKNSFTVLTTPTESIPS